MGLAFKVAANSPRRGAKYAYKSVMKESANPWKPWFAWRPVKVRNTVYWMTMIYRRPIPKTYVTYDDWTRYEYGDMFDVLKEAGH